MSGLRDGVRAGMSIVPTFVFMFLGYGLAAGVAHIPGPAAVAVTLLVFAAPAQFVMADVASQGAGVVQLVAVVVLVNLRFVVMSLTLAGAFGTRRRRTQVLWCQFVSATTFLTTFFRWRAGRVDDPLSFFQGVVLATVPAALLGTLAGLWLGRGVNEVVAFAAALFLPVYFALLLAGERCDRPELTAIILGFLLTPGAELLLPGWGLFAVAMVVGVVLYTVTAEETDSD